MASLELFVPEKTITKNTFNIKVKFPIADIKILGKFLLTGKSFSKLIKISPQLARELFRACNAKKLSLC